MMDYRSECTTTSPLLPSLKPRSRTPRVKRMLGTTIILKLSMRKRRRAKMVAVLIVMLVEKVALVPVPVLFLLRPVDTPVTDVTAVTDVITRLVASLSVAPKPSQHHACNSSSSSNSKVTRLEMLV